jgi:dsDNA-specific endonuclease/ATPase MutS2
MTNDKKTRRPPSVRFEIHPSIVRHLTVLIDPQGNEMTPGESIPGSEDPPVVLPIEDAVDLHAFAPRDIPSIVNEYLEECSRRGLREVRLIHGRGTGTQRAIVHALLTRHPLVESFTDAPPDRGGWGATVVSLRESSPPT